MTRSLQHAFNWCVIVSISLTGAGMVTAGFIPPLSPTMPLEEIALFYQENARYVRFGAVLIMTGVVFTAFFFAVLTLQISKFDERGKPIHTIFMALAGASNIIAAALPPFLIAVTAFRPERNAEALQVLHDLTWLSMVSWWCLPMLPCLGIGLAVVTSAKDQKIFPRWIGFYNLWLVFVFGAGALAWFFHTGTFAWDGLMVFWIPLALFGPWFIVMFWAIRGAIEQEPYHRAI